ncbi:hypothetical protein LCGC14_1874990, partial [marine sediment metagenome]
MNVIAVHNFIRAEVERQGFDLDTAEGMVRVSWMGLAWDYARMRESGGDKPSVYDILEMAYTIEPVRNARGFRQGPVIVRGQNVVDWRNVPNALHRLWKHGQHLSPIQFYTEFELIHPFNDGNGRVGAILYNWLNGTLEDPEAPADMFTGTGRGERIIEEEEGCCQPWWEVCCTKDGS